ncbi:MAG: arylsulfotransferase family protein [Solirubrobacteraceae bacterium]
MSRTRFVIALLAAAVAVGAAVVLATGALSGTGRKTSTPSAASPSCLPSTLNHSAKLGGLPVDVSPAPETDTANPHTQISFLGVAPAQIQDVSVVGEYSGHHSGQLHPYSQGDGASFVPDTTFDSGERVRVSATIGTDQSGAALNGRSGDAANDQSGSAANGQSGTGTNAKRVSFDFRVDTPYSTKSAPPFPNPQAAAADYQSFDTLPGVQVPVLSVTVPDRDPGAGDILTTNGPGPGQYGPLIYTPQGRLVWFDRLPGGETAEDLNVQSYEGRRDLTFWHGKVLSLGFGQGEDVVMNSHYQTVARVPGGNGLQADLHDFQIAPHGISYTTAFNAIRCNLSSVDGAGDGVILDTAVQEIDMKTGLVRWEWHSVDHVGAAESETPAPKSATPWDWFHVNSIDVEGGDAHRSGNIFISARSTWAGYQLEGGSGKILWRLGGLKSSFKMGPGTETAWQHDGRILSSGEVTFFDDGSNPPIHQQSRGLRIALDFATHEAHLIEAYTHPDPPLLTPSQGNMQTLADGNAVVGYGGVPAISEFAPGGTVLFDAHLPFDMSFYRAFRFPWSGRPSTPPTVLANLNNTGEEIIVHTSWNGATEAASWRVLAGQRPGSLTARTTIRASDFESSTILPKKYAYAAVQALDATGNVLGSSKPAKVSTYAAALPSTQQSG